MKKIQTKICSHCAVEKPATKTHFHLSINLQGLTSMCRKCKTEQRKRYKYEANRSEHFSTWMNGDSEIYL